MHYVPMAAVGQRQFGVTIGLLLVGEDAVAASQERPAIARMTVEIKAVGPMRVTVLHVVQRGRSLVNQIIIPIALYHFAAPAAALTPRQKRSITSPSSDPRLFLRLFPQACGIRLVQHPAASQFLDFRI